MVLEPVPGRAVRRRVVHLPAVARGAGYCPSEKYAHGAGDPATHARRIGEHFDLYRDACFQTRGDRASLGRGHAAVDRRAPTAATTMTARFVCMASGPLNRPKLPGIPGHRILPRPLVPHEPLGLRVHGRRRERRPHRARRPARRAHRDRRDGGAVRARTSPRPRSTSTFSSAPPRRSTCAATARPTRRGPVARAGLAAAPHGELQHPAQRAPAGRGPRQRRLDGHLPEPRRARLQSGDLRPENIAGHVRDWPTSRRWSRSAPASARSSRTGRSPRR